MQEPGDGHPEVVPHQHQGLHAATVALAQCLHQFGVLFLPFGVEPLLELVQDEQHLLPSWQPLSTAESCQGPLQASFGRHGGAALSQARQQLGLGLICRGLHVDRQDVASQSRQQTRLHQRGLAAARRTVDQAHRKGVVRVGLVDPCLPEADTVR